MSLRKAAAAIVVVIAAVAAGLAVGLLPARSVLLLILGLSAGLFVVYGRTATGVVDDAPASLIGPGRRADEPAATTGTDDFGPARIFYYAGLVLMSLVTVRAARLGLSDGVFLVSLLIASSELLVRRRQIPIRLPALLILGIGVFALGGVLSSFESYDPLRSVAAVVKVVSLTGA